MKPLQNASRIGHLSFLSEQAKQDLYDAALEILGAVGMRLNHDGARMMLLDAGATQSPAGHILSRASSSTARGRPRRPSSTSSTATASRRWSWAVTTATSAPART